MDGTTVTPPPDLREVSQEPPETFPQLIRKGGKYTLRRFTANQKATFQRSGVKVFLGLFISACIHLVSLQAEQGELPLHVNIVSNSKNSLSAEEQITLKKEIELVYKAYQDLYGIFFLRNIKLYIDQETFQKDYLAPGLFLDNSVTGLNWIDYNELPPILCLYLNTRGILRTRDFSSISIERVAVIAHEMGHNIFPWRALKSSEQEPTANFFAEDIIQFLGTKQVFPKSLVTGMLRFYPQFSQPHPYTVFLKNLVKRSGSKALMRASQELFQKFGQSIYGLSPRICSKEIKRIFDSHTNGWYSKLSFLMVNELDYTILTETKKGLFVEAAWYFSGLESGDQILTVNGQEIRNVDSLRKAFTRFIRRIPPSWKYASYPIPFTVTRKGKPIKLNLMIDYDFKQMAQGIKKELSWETIYQKPAQINYANIPGDLAYQFGEMFTKAMDVLNAYKFPTPKNYSVFIWLMSPAITNSCVQILNIYPSLDYKEFVLTLADGAAQPGNDCSFNMQNEILRLLLSTVAGFDPGLDDGFYLLMAHTLAQNKGILQQRTIDTNNLSDMLAAFFPVSSADIKRLYYSQYLLIPTLFLKLQSAYGQEGIIKMVQTALSKCDLRKKTLHGDLECISESCVIEYGDLEQYVHSHQPVGDAILTVIEKLKTIKNTPPVSFQES